MRLLPLACLLALACALPAFADDGPATAEKEPAAKPEPITVAKAVAAWPAPSAESAFTVEMVAVMGESPIGTYLVEVGPDVVDGKVAGWRIHERMELSFGDRRAVGDSVSRFTADLRPVTGESAENFDGTPTRTTWRVEGEQIVITEAPEGGEAKVRKVEVAAGLFPGKAGMFMAARFMPAASATVTGRDFSGTDEDAPLSPLRLTIDPAARHDGAKVLGFDGQRGAKRIALRVDPKTRAILHGEFSEEGKPFRLTLLPKAAAPATDDLFAREPKTAAEASAHVLYAITVKDKALVEKAFRWSTMYEVTKKQLEAASQPVPTLEEYKKTAVANLSAGKPDPNTTPGQIKTGLQMFVGKAQVQDTPEGWKAVIWPKSFAHILVVMEKKDDGWKAIGVRNLGN